MSHKSTQGTQSVQLEINLRLLLSELNPSPEFNLSGANRVTNLGEGEGGVPKSDYCSSSPKAAFVRRKRERTEEHFRPGLGRYIRSQLLSSSSSQLPPEAPGETLVAVSALLEAPQLESLLRVVLQVPSLQSGPLPVAQALIRCIFVGFGIDEGFIWAEICCFTF